MASESVETTILSILAPRADFIVYAIKGIPFNSFMFFNGIPFEPPRAGITANILFLLICNTFLNFPGTFA
jgi:hypothetical protein